jgi:branched-chain amino acid transport system permease protein
MGHTGMTVAIILQIIINSLLPISILSLTTFAIILIYKTSATTNFAQGIISILGAHVSAYLFSILGWNLYLSIIFGMVLSFVIGILIDTQIFRRAKLIFPVGKQMITLGIVLIFIGFIPITFSRYQLSMGRLMDGNANFTLFGVNLTMTNHALITTGLTLVILLGLFIALKYTKWGLGVRATASQETVARMMGVNTRTITALSWAIAAGLGSLAATLFSANLLFDAVFMTPIQINAFLAGIIGGFTSFVGPLVGATLLTIVGNLIGFSFSLEREVLVYGLILILILIKPNGLLGKKVIKKV